MNETTRPQPAPLAGMVISGYGVVVPDALATIQQYAQLFGITDWHIEDLELHEDRAYHGTCLRVARASASGLVIELIEPMGGDNSFTRFAATQGAGVHHLCLTSEEDASTLLDRLYRANIESEMYVDADGAPLLNIVDTTAQLGTRLSLTLPGHGIRSGWHANAQPDKTCVALATRPLVQIGIVVPNARSFAENFNVLTGLEPFRTHNFQSHAEWQGVYRDLEVIGLPFHVRAAMADWQGIEIELLEPVAGTSTHRDFLSRHGAGIHHLSFGVVPDHDELIDSLVHAGMGTEMAGQLPGGFWFTYLASHNRLGTIYELVRQDASSS